MVSEPGPLSPLTQPHFATRGKKCGVTLFVCQAWVLACIIVRCTFFFHLLNDVNYTLGSGYSVRKMLLLVLAQTGK